MIFKEEVLLKVNNGLIPQEVGTTIISFYADFKQALSEEGLEVDDGPLFDFLTCVVDEVQNPFTFAPYHEKMRSPFDYYQMGLDFFRPLIKFDESSVVGKENLVQVQHFIESGENVVFLSNHQAEPDPQVISLLLEDEYPKLAEEMIFVAGHRVISDPLTKPFSRGRNLLCIYSKKYIENPPEKRLEKQQHNQQTMLKMSELLAVGGKCIYVAPSGGRDRLGTNGEVEVAAFDPQSIEMFLLMAKKAGTTTHFFPLSIFSYNLLPPPNAVKKDIGEKRTTKRTPIHLCIGRELDMVNFPGSDETDKLKRRQNRAHYIWDQVNQGYEKIK